MTLQRYAGGRAGVKHLLHPRGRGHPGPPARRVPDGDSAAAIARTATPGDLSSKAAANRPWRFRRRAPDAPAVAGAARHSGPSRRVVTAGLHAETPHAPEQPAAQQDPGAYADLPGDVDEIGASHSPAVRRRRPGSPRSAVEGRHCITAADPLPDDLRDALNAVHENWHAH